MNKKMNEDSISDANNKIPLISKILGIGLTAACLPIVLLIAFWPDVLISAINGLGIADKETLNEKVNQLFVDIILAYVVCLFGIVADALCRMRLNKSLINALFFDNHNRRISFGFRMGALIASILGVVIILDFFLMGRDQEHWLYVEDGPMENLTALSFLIAGALLMWTAITTWMKQKSSAKSDVASGAANRKTDFKKLVLAGFAGFVLLLVAGEEVSWGQRVFGIETPELLSQVNTQQEFNFHNIFTDYFKYAYFVIATIVFAVTWKSFLLWLNKQETSWREFLPDATLLFLAAEILCFSFHLMFNELVEPIAAMYVMLFAWQLCRPYWSVAGDLQPNPTDAQPTS